MLCCVASGAETSEAGERSPSTTCRASRQVTIRSPRCVDCLSPAGSIYGMTGIEEALQWFSALGMAMA